MMIWFSVADGVKNVFVRRQSTKGQSYIDRQDEVKKKTAADAGGRGGRP